MKDSALYNINTASDDKWACLDQENPHPEQGLK